jgi:hypothetical protein
LVSTEDKEFLNSWCLSLAIKSTLSHPIRLTLIPLTWRIG